MKITRKQFLGAGGASLMSVAAGRVGKAVSPVQDSSKRTRRWAMVIDVPKCLQKQGCTKCSEACHAAHNVPAIPDRAREVKWIWKEPFKNVFPSLQTEFIQIALRNQPIPITCNHCVNPPCVRVCPTGCTFKREDGIVAIDWHRCVGCRYCIAACPYGSRSFNWSDPRPYIRAANPGFPTRTKGVVEKCTLCEERLARGQLPACVEACPEKAMIFGDIEDPASAVRQALKTRFGLQRKPELGTQPQIYYIL